MTRTFMLLAVLLISTSCCAQRIYYGYPIPNYTPNKGDRIILNIPDNMDSRFLSSSRLESLVEFIKKHNHLHLKIYINVFYGSTEYSKDYSQRLCGDLNKILSERTKHSEYSIVANGREMPIFLDKSDQDNYMKMNTRMEIVID